MPKVVFIPPYHASSEVVDGAIIHQVGYAQKTQQMTLFAEETSLIWSSLSYDDLTAGEEGFLTPSQIGHRLWTTYNFLNSLELASSTKASTCIYDGVGNIITATVGNSSTFAAAYDQQGVIIGVARLNKRDHNTTRAIGSPTFCADAQIDIHSIDSLANEFKVEPSAIAKMQIISTCAGFTRCAKDGSIGEQEQLLLDILDNGSIHGRSEIDLARLIIQQTTARNPYCSMSVIVQTLTNGPSLLGLYNGQSDGLAANFVTEKMVPIFVTQCDLTETLYSQQSLSVHKNLPRYLRDNVDTSLANLQNGPRLLIRIPREIYRRYSLFPQSQAPIPTSPNHDIGGTDSSSSPLVVEATSPREEDLMTILHAYFGDAPPLTATDHSLDGLLDDFNLS
ncbi:MAG: hypothetical protein EPN84_05700 [Legionella sp.]|nr:MAG: hypothetical protein EPN84_05700 [Legionella sp.]